MHAFSFDEAIQAYEYYQGGGRAMGKIVTKFAN